MLLQPGQAPSAHLPNRSNDTVFRPKPQSKGISGAARTDQPILPPFVLNPNRFLDSLGNVVVTVAHTLVAADLGVLALALLHKSLQLSIIAFCDGLGLHLDN